MEDVRELGAGRRRGRERWKRRCGIGGKGQLEGVVEGDGGVAERRGGCERLEEAVCGCGRRPGDVEVVEHCGRWWWLFWCFFFFPLPSWALRAGERCGWLIYVMVRSIISLVM